MGTGVLVRKPNRASAYHREHSPSSEELPSPGLCPADADGARSLKTQRTGPVISLTELEAGERRHGSDGCTVPNTPASAAPAMRGDVVGPP